MAHRAETLLPWKEYCCDLNHSEILHISRAKMVCKMHTPVYLFDGCSNKFKHHHLVSKIYFLNTIKQENTVFFLWLLNSFHCKKFFFQNKGFHFYYCNYWDGCLNGMTEENIQAHLNDCSQHSSKFICHECGMISENFLWCMHFFYFQFKTYFIYSKQIF